MGVTYTTATGATYTPIASVNVGGTTGTTFSSISQLYTDLVLVITDVTNTSTNQGILIHLNGDTGGNYSRTGLRADGSTASSFRQSNNTDLAITSDGTVYNPEPSIVHFMNYSNTTTYKTVLSRSNDSSAGTNAHVNLWRNTSAVTSIEVVESSGNFGTGATVSVYGILGA